MSVAWASWAPGCCGPSAVAPLGHVDRPTNQRPSHRPSTFLPRGTSRSWPQGHGRPDLDPSPTGLLLAHHVHYRRRIGYSRGMHSDHCARSTTCTMCGTCGDSSARPVDHSCRIVLQTLTLARNSKVTAYPTVLFMLYTLVGLIFTSVVYSLKDHHHDSSSMMQGTKYQKTSQRRWHHRNKCNGGVERDQTKR